jgi:CPA2 family monovalent cation:H+ antiporter-2
MHAPPFLTDLVIVLGIAVVVVLVLSRFRLPTIAGFIAAGALIGPSGLGFISKSGDSLQHIESLAEIGVVLLLFTIGLEFSLTRLRRIWKSIVVGGALQVGVTTLAVMAAALALGESVSRGIFFGFLVCMSSTAIVLRALAERRETDAPHGRMTVGVLVFQDLTVVPMMLVVPMLGGKGGGPSEITVALLKALAVIVGTLIIARLVVPRVLGLVARSRKRELFLLSALLACVGIAWVTSLAGLSLALGAFLAGIALADSEVGHQALAEVLPFREAFTSLFFVSIGMLFDIDVVMDAPGQVLGLAGAVLLGKGLIVTVAAALLGFPLRAAVLAGVGLAGIGEFSFVLAQVGRASGLLDRHEHQLFVAVSVVTVVITPIIIRFGPTLAAGAARFRRLENLLGGDVVQDKEQKELEGHVIIAGYGVAGRTLGEALAATGVAHVICDLNPDAVRAARGRGVRAYYADITSPENAEHLGIHRARELVLMINDPEAARRGLVTCRTMAPRLPIVVRVKYVAEAEPLRKLGATDVIVEEFETAMEIVARVLRAAGVPRNVIEERLHAARMGTPMRRPMTLPRKVLGELDELAGLKIETYLVRAGHWAAEATIAEVHLQAAGAGFIAGLRRGERTLMNPKPFESLQVDDVLYLLVSSKGGARHMLEILELGEPRPEPPAVDDAAPA